MKPSVCTQTHTGRFARRFRSGTSSYRTVSTYTSTKSNTCCYWPYKLQTCCPRLPSCRAAALVGALVRLRPTAFKKPGWEIPYRLHAKRRMRQPWLFARCCNYDVPVHVAGAAKLGSVGVVGLARGGRRARPVVRPGGRPRPR